MIYVVAVLAIGVVLLLLALLKTRLELQQALSAGKTGPQPTAADINLTSQQPAATNAEIFDHYDQLVKEKNNIEQVRLALAEKNKKIWKMSEAALREKHRLEELASELQAKNELLDIERARLAEKVKKLWQTSITVHKEREKANNAREHLAAEREKHLGYIQAQGEVLKDIAFAQAHEVRGPLSTLMGLVNLINMDDLSDPENIELLEGIAAVASRLDNVVTELVNKENAISLNQNPVAGDEENA